MANREKENWLKVAEKLEAEKEARKCAQEDADRAERGQEEERKLQEIADATAQLTRFIDSPAGEAAKRLLWASGRKIDLTYSEDDGGASVWNTYFGGNGLEYFHATNVGRTASIYSPEPRPKSISPQEALLSVLNSKGELKPNGVVRHIRNELNRIANDRA